MLQTASRAVAAVQEDDNDLEEVVAALSMQPKRPQPKKKATKGKSTVCFVHKKYGDDTWKAQVWGCMDWLLCLELILNCLSTLHLPVN